MTDGVYLLYRLFKDSSTKSYGEEKPNRYSTNNTPIGDRLVELQPPGLKPSPAHDALPMHGARISRSSARNCRMSKLALAKSRQPALRDDLLLDSRELVDAGGAAQSRVR